MHSEFFFISVLNSPFKQEKEKPLSPVFLTPLGRPDFDSYPLKDTSKPHSLRLQYYLLHESKDTADPRKSRSHLSGELLEDGGLVSRELDLGG